VKSKFLNQKLASKLEILSKYKTSAVYAEDFFAKAGSEA
jgi:hypothetical protein